MDGKFLHSRGSFGSVLTSAAGRVAGGMTDRRIGGGAHVWIYLDGWVHKVLNLLDSCMGSDQILRAFNLGPCSGLIAVLRRVAECMYMAPATLGTWPRDYPNEVVI